MSVQTLKRTKKKRNINFQEQKVNTSLRQHW